MKGNPMTPEQLKTLSDAAAILEQSWTATSARPLLLGEDTAAATNRRAICDYLRLRYAPATVEHAAVVLIDRYGRLINIEQLSQGDETSTAITPRIVGRAAIAAGALYVVLCHNHPGGNCKPIPQDLKTTGHLVRALQILGVTVLDHVVVAANGCASIRAIMAKTHKGVWPSFMVEGTADE
jgi:DNA repair protein RadC